MAFCGKCGTKVDEGVKFCPACGAQMEETEQTAQQTQNTQQQTENKEDFGAKIAGLNNTKDSTSNFDAADIAQNKGMTVLAYLGLLWLIPFFAKKDSPYTRYHCKQGFNLLLVEIAYTIVSSILRAIIKVPYNYYGYYVGSYTPGWLSTILWLISIPILILAIIGIINAANGKAKELPIIGKFKILK